MSFVKGIVEQMWFDSKSMLTFAQSHWSFHSSGNHWNFVVWSGPIFSLGPTFSLDTTFSLSPLFHSATLFTLLYFFTQLNFHLTHFFTQ